MVYYGKSKVYEYQRKILNLIKQGHNAGQASKFLKLPAKSVSRLVKEKGWHLLPEYNSIKKSLILPRKEIMKEKEQEIVAWVKAGKSVTKLASKLNVPLSYFRHWLAKNQLNRKHFIPTPSEVIEKNKEWIKEQILAGRSATEVSKEIQVLQLSLTTWLINNNFEYAYVKEEVTPPKSALKQSFTALKMRKKPQLAINNQVVSAPKGVHKKWSILHTTSLGEEAEKLLRQGYNPTAISRKLNLDKTGVARYARDKGLNQLNNYATIHSSSRKSLDFKFQDRLEEVESLLSHKSVFQAAKELKIDYCVFRRWLKRNHIITSKLRSEHLEPKLSEINAMLAQGQTIHQISKKLKSNERTIISFLDRIGLKYFINRKRWVLKK